MRALTLPAPQLVFKPILWSYLSLRSFYYGALRLLICEPLFKAYCTSYGRNVRTGCFLHWVVGQGRIVLGDNVLLDGKSSFAFATLCEEQPLLEVGSGTIIAHGCDFSVGKRISIGSNCMIAGDVRVFDSPGHPNDPEARLRHLPPDPSSIKPVTIGANVWIGARSIIFPGVTIGDGSVISAGSVVLSSVPPNVLVGGNPARKVLDLVAKPEQRPPGG